MVSSPPGTVTKRTSISSLRQLRAQDGAVGLPHGLVGHNREPTRFEPIRPLRRQAIQHACADVDGVCSLTKANVDCLGHM